jgi:hypothetical protein
MSLLAGRDDIPIWSFFGNAAKPGKRELVIIVFGEGRQSRARIKRRHYPPEQILSCRPDSC